MATNSKYWNTTEIRVIPIYSIVIIAKTGSVCTRLCTFCTHYLNEVRAVGFVQVLLLTDKILPTATFRIKSSLSYITHVLKKCSHLHIWYKHWTVSLSRLCWIFIPDLLIAQLVMKSSDCCGTQGFVTVFTRAPNWILSWTSLMQSVRHILLHNKMAQTVILLTCIRQGFLEIGRNTS
jgi:hypothetical protein